MVRYSNGVVRCTCEVVKCVVRGSCGVLVVSCTFNEVSSGSSSGESALDSSSVFNEMLTPALHFSSYVSLAVSINSITFL